MQPVSALTGYAGQSIFNSWIPSAAKYVAVMGGEVTSAAGEEYAVLLR